MVTLVLLIQTIMDIVMRPLIVVVADIAVIVPLMPALMLSLQAIMLLLMFLTQTIMYRIMLLIQAVMQVIVPLIQVLMFLAMAIIIFVGISRLDSCDESQCTYTQKGSPPVMSVFHGLLLRIRLSGADNMHGSEWSLTSGLKRENAYGREV